MNYPTDLQSKAPISLKDYRLVRRITLSMINDRKHSPEGSCEAKTREVMRNVLVSARHAYYVLGDRADFVETVTWSEFDTVQRAEKYSDGSMRNQRRIK